jgi:hypothetical protein
MIQTLHNGVLEVQIICIRMTGQVLLTTTDVALLMMLVSVWKSARKVGLFRQSHIFVCIKFIPS